LKPNSPGHVRGNRNAIVYNPGGVEFANPELFCKFIIVLKGKIMSTYTQFLYQFVFSSKGRKPFLSGKNQDILFAYIAGILKNKSCHSYIVGGANDHIHIITHVHPAICPSYLIKDIKEATHLMIGRERSLFQNFPGWQVGYGGFTYHISSKNALINYVRNQEEHHKIVSYKEELIRMLEEHDIGFREEYLFT
jgi:REP element-mobilizing transposase RayT